MADTFPQKQRTDFLEKSKLLQSLDQVSEILPIPFYCLNTNHTIMAMNKIGLNSIGFPPPYENAIGITSYDLYPEELAVKLDDNQKEVYRTQKTVVAEEVIKNVSTGKIQIYTATLMPLFDDTGSMMGIIGTSIEITDLKEKQQLELSKEQKKIKSEIEKNIVQAINQNAQDILSALGGLLKTIKSCQHIPDSDRIALQDTSTQINNAANQLLNIKESDGIERGHKHFYSLTERQQECAFFLIRGCTYKEIAKELNIGISTVQTHIEHIKEKWDMVHASQSELIKYMLYLGFMCLIPKSFLSNPNRIR